MMNYSPNHAMVKLQGAGLPCDYDTTGGGCMAIWIDLGDDYILVTDSEGPFSGWADNVQSESFAVGRYPSDGSGYYVTEVGEMEGGHSPVTLENLATVVGNLAAMEIVWPK